MMDEIENQVKRQSRQFNRRQVLAMGTLAAASSIVPHSAWADEALRLAAMPGVDCISVGFLDAPSIDFNLTRFLSAFGEARIDSTEADAALPRLVSAESIAGDASMWDGPVRVRIHGLAPVASPSHRAGGHGLPASIHLDLQVPSLDPSAVAGPFPFFAWSYHGRGPNSSPPSSFVVPIQRQRVLELHLGVQTEGGTTRTYQTRFLPGDLQGQPRLRQGMYVLSPAAAPWAAGLSGTDAGGPAAAPPFSILMSFSPEAPPLASS